MKKFPPKRSLAAWFIMVLLIAMIPLLLIYYTAYSSNVHVLQEEIAGSLRRQNVEFTEHLQDDMAHIVSTNFMLSQNWELGKLSVVPDEFTGYQKAMAFRNIQDKIYLVQLTSRFIQDISVYFPTMDKCLTTSSINSMLAEMRTITEELDQLPKDQFIYHRGNMILVSETTFSNELETPNLVIRTTLSQKELIHYFHDFYWNQISSGTVTSLHSQDWLAPLAPDSLEERFRQQIIQEVDPDTKTIQESQFLANHEGHTYQVIYSYIPFVDLLLIRYFDLSQVRQAMGMSSTMPAFFAAVVALAFLMVYYALYQLVNRPLKRLTTAFGEVEKGNLDVKLAQEAKGEFAYVFHGFSHMLSRLKILMEQTYLQGQMVKKSELKQLQAQIDPHFLYNGFFILNKRIRSGDQEGALAFSQLLSDYFQYVTKNARDAVPLQEEVTHAYNYARIQQIRFKNRLSLTLEPVPDICADLLIPRLVLQPIVENFFKHVLDREEGTTSLRISFRPTEQGVDLLIEDSGSELADETISAMRSALEKPVDEKEVSGLANVHRRLKLYFGESYGLTFDRSDMGGLMVCMHILNGKETVQ